VLRDCDLTRKGRQQASAVAASFSDIKEFHSIELVVSSPLTPLTRALHTSLLAFPRQNIIVNYDLREIGSGIQEHIPRKTKDVLKDLRRTRKSCMMKFSFYKNG
jgi:broad specificity phosphatase PhoE